MKTPENVPENNVGRKTPEEIKKILGNPSNYTFGFYSLFNDALAYIQQLEAERDDLRQRNIFLKTNWKQAERERDAAVVDIRNAKWMLCHVCKNYYRPDPAIRHYACKEFGEFSEFLNPSDFAEDGYDFPSLCGKFEWRGVCPENTKEDIE